MKIAVFEAEEHEAAAFDRFKPAHQLAISVSPLGTANVDEAKEAEIVSVFIYSELRAEILAKLPKLKLIATRSTGFDHIDRAYCRAHDIAIVNVPTYGENTVAEHVFALLLALSHRLPEAIARARSGNFSPEGLQGFDLSGRTIGVVGTGNIGVHVIRIAKGFAMNVIACDLHPVPSLAEQLGFRYVTFDELLSQSDVVSLHVPATPETTDLLSAATIGRMKKGAIIINTARGSLIDTAALIGALRSGQIAGAGLDVLPEEPMIREEAELVSTGFSSAIDLRDLVANHVLLTMPNVVVTPHSAFNTVEAVGRITETTIANIDAFLAGTPQNLVV